MANKIGLGFMRYNLNKDYSKLIGYALEHNINYFETCYFYLDYQCEQFVNNLLKPYPRDTYEICGKFSFTEASRSSCFQDFYYNQLRKVNGNYFDVYLLHCLRPAAIPYLKYEIIDFFQKEKEKGHIKRFGFSEQCDNIMLSKILSLGYNWDIAQMPLNFFDWYLNYSKDNYELITNNNIPIIAQAPLKGGELFNNAAEAISFVVNKNPSVILTGTQSLNHLQFLQENIKNPVELNYQKIFDIINIYRKEHFIQCAKCSQCQNICPLHIPIPLFYDYMNLYLQSNIKEPLTTAHYFLQEPMITCIQCHSCEQVCPFSNYLFNYSKAIFNLQP